MDATLNARMDSTLKERGDKVLRDNGISVSTAVRALWQELASTRELPDFLRKASKGDVYLACKDRAFRDEIGMNYASTYKSRPLRQDVIEKQPDR